MLALALAPTSKRSARSVDPAATSASLSRSQPLSRAAAGTIPMTTSLVLALACVALALLPNANASPFLFPTPTLSPDTQGLALVPVPARPTPGAGFLERLIAEKRQASAGSGASALTAYQATGSAAAQWPYEIIPPRDALWPTWACEDRCADFGNSVERCKYKPEVGDVNSTCVCKSEVQRQMFMCFECEMVHKDRKDVWNYFVALSDRLIRQCEQDDQAVNLTHFALKAGWTSTRGASGKYKQVYVTQAFFQPSGAQRRLDAGAGLGGIALGVGAMLGLMGWTIL